MSYLHRLLVFAIFIIGLSFYAKADALPIDLGAVKKPLSASVSDDDFLLWKKVLNGKKSQLNTLLKNANINLENGVYLNSLINSHSPYLLRHSVNPVNWLGNYKDALAEAQKSNKLIFLSIGYSTCHWCHVMEKESFLDVEVAKALNKEFISVKLDREVDIELDRLFSSKQQVVKGESGWPINAILTADGKLFWTDAYVSKSDLVNVLNKVTTLWQQRPEQINQVAANLEAQFSSSLVENVEWDPNVLNTRLDQVSAQLDPKYGGLKGDIKFPNAALLSLMLYQYQLAPSEQTKTRIRLFLDGMIDGGIRDNVRGGFFRYAQSSDWQHPHFEKMLYNQALLISVYAKASAIFNEPTYALVVQQTVDFLNSELRAPSGGFYSAIDADYEGIEGRYYLYTKQELEAVGEGWTSKYQWQPHHNSEMFQPFGIELSANYKDSPLFKMKQGLATPHIDKKILTSWNALLVIGLLDAHVYLKDKKYLVQGIALLEYLLSTHTNEDELIRAVNNGNQFGAPSLEDYAWLSEALVKANVLTQNNDYLDKAVSFYKYGAQHMNTLPKEVNWLSDQELMSPLVSLSHVARQLAFFGKLPNATTTKHLNILQKYISNQANDYFMALLYLLQENHPSFELVQLFARGNGRAWLRTEGDQVIIDISLTPGWHINSNKPLEQNLIATEVVLEKYKGLSVVYPKDVKRKLGFSQNSLSLFDGSFSISIPVKNKETGKVTVNLQACSESLCLLPESLKYHSPLN